MADSNTQFQRWMRQAADHKKHARWELAENTLHDAESLCSRPRFPNAAQCQLQVQLELAEVTRRHGNYAAAIKAQETIVRSAEIDELRKCKVYGELGVNYRHSDRIAEAAEVFQKHYDHASKLAFEMDAEVCRAVGNLAMSQYQLYVQLSDQTTKTLLLASINLQEERVERAQALRHRLDEQFNRTRIQESQLANTGIDDVWVANWMARLHTWEAIGVSRLTLSYLADGRSSEAVRHGEQAVAMTKDAAWADPTVRAMSRFFHGHALLKDERVDEARKEFDFPQSMTPNAVGVCTPVIALCKELSAEHRQYLREVIDQGVDLTSFDEQGYSALDYAVYCGDSQATSLLKKGLVLQSSVEEQDKAYKMALIRKHFREIFHTQFRPILQRGSTDCIQALRSKYVELLRKEADKRHRFDVLRLIKLNDFKERGCLPLWHMDDSTSRKFEEIKSERSEEPFLIFFSYRWMGKDSDPASRNPDTPEHLQYERMLDALEQLLENYPNVKEEDVYIWLVSVIQSHDCEYSLS
jgi:tetratricopeptide (TPR) repeat protein